MADKPRCEVNKVPICVTQDGKEICRCEPVQTCLVHIAWEPGVPHTAQVTHANCDPAAVAFALTVLAGRMAAAAK